MKIIKRIIIVCVLLVVIVWTLSLITGCSIIITVTKPEPFKTFEFKKGDIVNPLKSFDFDKGNWVAYLVISRNDFENLHPAIKKAKCLKIKDGKLLKQMQDKWYFVYTGGDVATVESAIYFFKDGKLVFKSCITLDKELIGLQNRDYGWLDPKNSAAIIESCKSFKKLYLPIIFL
jgi:hypothetical protein